MKSEGESCIRLSVKVLQQCAVGTSPGRAVGNRSRRLDAQSAQSHHSNLFLTRYNCVSAGRLNTLMCHPDRKLVLHMAQKMAHR